LRLSRYSLFDFLSCFVPYIFAKLALLYVRQIDSLLVAKSLGGQPFNGVSDCHV